MALDATACAVSAAACAAALMSFGLGTFWLAMLSTMTHIDSTGAVCRKLSDTLHRWVAERLSGYVQHRIGLSTRLATVHADVPGEPG